MTTIKQIFYDYRWGFRLFGFCLLLALLCLPLQWLEPYVKFQLTPLGEEWFGFCEARFLFIVHYLLVAALCLLCWWVQHQTSYRWIQLPARFFYIFPGFIAYKVATAFSFNSSYILHTPFFVILRVWHREEVQVWLEEAIWRAQKIVSPEEYIRLLDAILAEGCETKATIQQCILKHVYATVEPTNPFYWEFLKACGNFVAQEPVLSVYMLLSAVIFARMIYRILRETFGDDGGDDGGDGGNFPFFPDDDFGGPDDDNSFHGPKPPSSKINIKTELKDFDPSAPPVKLKDVVLGNVQPPSTTNLPTAVESPNASLEFPNASLEYSNAAATSSNPLLTIRSLQGVESISSSEVKTTKLPTFLDSPPATPKESTNYSKLPSASVKEPAPTITIEKGSRPVESPSISETVESPSPISETVESPSPISETVESPSISETVENPSPISGTAAEIVMEITEQTLDYVDFIIDNTTDPLARAFLIATQGEMHQAITAALTSGSITADILPDVLHQEHLINPIVDMLIAEFGITDVEAFREQFMEYWGEVLIKAMKE